MSDSKDQVLATISADGAKSATFFVAGTTPRRLLVWLPAMGMPARHYLALAHALAARGTAVALHEWRGIGASDRRAGRRSNWGYRELIDFDVPATLAAVDAVLSGVPVFIGGHSLGGQLATLLAAMSPGRYSGLAVVASGAPYWRRFPLGWMLYLAYVMAPLAAGIVGYLPGRRFGFAGNEARGVTRDWACSGRSGRYAARDMATDFEALLDALAVPAIGIRMTDDWMVPVASLDWLLRSVPQSRRTHVTLDRAALGGTAAGHFDWMKQPAAVAAALDRWWSA